MTDGCFTISLRLPDSEISDLKESLRQTKFTLHTAKILTLILKQKHN
jgi:hypothetical protein